MIDLYTWKTSNGRKLTIMLEELGVPYNLHPVNIGADEQFSPEFVKLNPNSKIPVLVDSEGPDGQPFTLFESGAMLMYLAEKYGKFWPQDQAKRYEVVQWLMFQMGGIGPIFGQVHHFLRAAKEEVPYAIKRYTTENRRLYGVLNNRLDGRDWIAAGEYTIADIATFPWVARYDWQKVDLAEFPNVKRWFDGIMARPAVQKGMELPAT